MTDLVKIVFTVPEAEAEDCQAFLAQSAPQGWQEEAAGPDAISFCIFVEDQRVGQELADAIAHRWPAARMKVSAEEREDWGRAWMEFFVPLACGERFEILPPWLADSGNPGLTPVIIEPKQAFGTGHHPTTALCMEGIARLVQAGAAQPDGSFLDLGTGTGILGIALCKLGMRGIGLDIDPLAVACAKENLALNGVTDAMGLAVGSLDVLAPGQQFDVIVANILSGPLISMAPVMRRHLGPGSALLLSGILAEQAEAVAQAYRDQGLGEPAFHMQGEWAALSFIPQQNGPA